MNGGMEQGKPDAIQGTLSGTTRIFGPNGGEAQGDRIVGEFSYLVVYSQEQIWLLDLRFNPAEPVSLGEIRGIFEGVSRRIFQSIEGAVEEALYHQVHYKDS